MTFGHAFQLCLARESELEALVRKIVDDTSAYLEQLRSWFPEPDPDPPPAPASAMSLSPSTPADEPIVILSFPLTRHEQESVRRAA